MPQEVRTEVLGTVKVNAFGNKFVIPVNRGGILRELFVRWNGTLTGGTPATWNLSTNLGRGDEWGVFSRIDLVQNGNDYLRSFTGYAFRMFQRSVLGSLPRLQNTVGDGTTVSPVFDSVAFMPLSMWNAHTPIDTALDTRVPNKLQLEFTTDAPANLSASNAPTGVDGTLEVVAVQGYQEGPHPETTMRIGPISVSGNASKTKVQLDVPTNCAYRGFLINCAASDANPSADKAYIYRVALKSGSTTFLDAPWAVLKEMERYNSAFSRQITQRAAADPDIANSDTFANDWTSSPTNTSVGTGPYVRAAKSELLNEDAWCYIDLCKDGYLTEAINLNGLAQGSLEFDVYSGSNNWTITVWPIQLYPNG